MASPDSQTTITFESPTTFSSRLLPYSCCSGGWSSPYPQQLDVVDFTYVPELDQTTVSFLLGGRMFDLSCSAALFPSAVAAVEYSSPGPEINVLFSELAELLRRTCGRQLLKFNREHFSLRAFLHVWNISAQPYDGHFILGFPTPGKRIDGLFEGIEYHDLDLPWYGWKSIAVLEKMSDTHFSVAVNGQRFGCYVPDGAFEYDDYSIFLQEVRTWKRITGALNVPCSIPLLEGFVYSERKPTQLQGVLYEWVEQSNASPYLSNVDVDKVPKPQRKAWVSQIEDGLAFLHANSASFTREGCKGDITERIIITTSMEARLRLIHFGEGEAHRGSMRFVPHERADHRALAEIRRFLKIETDTTHVVNSRTLPFFSLPAEMRNRIYEILLVLPGCVKWLWGYRHQTNAVMGLAGSQIPGLGLLRTNRQIRQESLSFLVSRNILLLDAVWLNSFLRTSMRANSHSDEIMVGSCLKRVTLTVTLTWDKRSMREQRKGIKELLKYSSSLSHVDLLIYNKHSWHWEDDSMWADLKELPGIHLEEHWDNAFLDRIGISASSLALAHLH